MAAEVSLGAIVRSAGVAYVRTQKTSSIQRKVLRAVAACRTPALGGHRDRCDRCQFEHMLWHSCRNRHCPRCQALARARWLDARSDELLPVPYFHVVFTVPDLLNEIALVAPKLFYELLFRAVGRTLVEIADSRLHASIGVLAVLHTWGQTLSLHPHIHCVVPGGGFSTTRNRWLGVRKRTFFLPVKVLSRRFRTIFCNALRDAWKQGQLKALSERFADRTAFELFLSQCCRKDWVVYSKAPFGGPKQVLAYLAAYTHRIAISNRRILSFENDRVRFAYRDYRTRQQKVMELSSSEFLRRFLLHVLPSRFVRIRYYGFLANRHRKASLEQARSLITTTAPPQPSAPRPAAASRLCPTCGLGVMVVIELVAPDISYWNDS
ncbi:MAG: IS91 family transposase [Gemmatimonadaceae bacterium]|nr:IS91 family transposase [Gemmatimonadaceae bacterium]